MDNYLYSRKIVRGDIMNDSLYEQIVIRKARWTDVAIKILIVVVIVLLFFIFLPLIGIMSLFLPIILYMLAYRFLFPKLKVEYEYSLFNHDFDIAAIYNKASRKAKLSFNIKNTKMMAPKNSPRLANFKSYKVRDFTSGIDSKYVYAIIISDTELAQCIYIEPDDVMLDHIKPYLGRNLYLD